MNLLANAIDALDESNVGKSFAEIQAQPNCITVTTELSNDQQWAIVRIHDNGIGMTESTQSRVFENLFTTKGVGKGTGLGLAIARQVIVEKHGGMLEVNSTLGQGTEFIIKLPVATR
jgi:signal transduction histidine kinase